MDRQIGTDQVQIQIWIQIDICGCLQFGLDFYAAIKISMSERCEIICYNMVRDNPNSNPNPVFFFQSVGKSKGTSTKVTLMQICRLTAPSTAAARRECRRLGRDSDVGLKISMSERCKLMCCIGLTPDLDPVRIQIYLCIQIDSDQDQIQIQIYVDTGDQGTAVYICIYLFIYLYIYKCVCVSITFHGPFHPPLSLQVSGAAGGASRDVYTYIFIYIYMCIYIYIFFFN